MDKVEQAAEKGGPWLTVEEALQAIGGLPFTKEDRGRATQWLDENCRLVRHWTLPKILAAYAAHVTAEQVKPLVEALRKARDTFRRYANMHRNEMTVIGLEKALRNEKLADEIDETLKLFGER